MVVPGDPKHPWTHVRQGTLAYLSGDFEGAIEDLNRAIELNPEYARAYAERGEVKCRKGDLQEAVKDLEKAIRLDPTCCWALESCGRIKASLGLREAAIADFSRAIDIDPNLYWIYRRRFEVRREMGDLEGAMNDVRNMCRLMPNNISNYLIVGQILLERGDLTGAVNEFNEGIRNVPQSASRIRPALMNRAMAKALLENRVGALEDFVRCFDLDPDRPYPAIWIAGLGGGTERLEAFVAQKTWTSELARFFLGRLSADELIAKAKEAVDASIRNKHHSEALAFIGMRSERDGDPDGACRAYEACVGLGVRDSLEHRWSALKLARYRDR